jgi:hypothetical protein
LAHEIETDSHDQWVIKNHLKRKKNRKRKEKPH